MDNRNNPIRILHITEMLSAAGIESYIMNNYRRIDRTKVQFDFLVLRDQEEYYDEEVNRLGGRKYCISINISNTLLRILEESRQIKKFLKKNHYDIVHIHYTTPLRAPYLLAVKQAGVKTRIYHSHSAYVSGKSQTKMIVYKMMQKGIYKWATHFFACSEAAAEWMYDEKTRNEKDVKVMFNGIDTVKFSFHPDERKKIRTQLGIEEKFVIIHTGRFKDQKNQSFILDVFKYFLSRNANSVLLLLGEGELLQEMKEKATYLGISNVVFFLGVKSNVADYLSAADCYIMPSLYEGLPVAAIEAECCGLPCVFSKNITREVELCPEVSFLGLDESLENWSRKLEEYKHVKRNPKAAETIKKAGYDVQDCADMLQKFYIEQSSRER